MGVDWGQVFRGYVPTAMALQREDESARRWKEEQASRRTEADRAEAYRQSQMKLSQAGDARAQGQYEQLLKDREKAEAKLQRLGAAAKRYETAKARREKGDFGFIPEYIRDVGYNEDRPPFNNGRGAHYVGLDHQGNPMVQEYDLKTLAPVGSGTSYTPGQVDRMLHNAYMAEVADIDPAAYAAAQRMAIEQGKLGVMQQEAGTHARRADTADWLDRIYRPQHDAAQRAHGLNVANIQAGPSWAKITDDREERKKLGELEEYYAPRLASMEQAVLAAPEGSAEQRAALGALQLEAMNRDRRVNAALGRAGAAPSAASYGSPYKQPSGGAPSIGAQDFQVLQTMVEERARKIVKDNPNLPAPQATALAVEQMQREAARMGASVKGLGAGAPAAEQGVVQPSAQLKEAAKRKASESAPSAPSAPLWQPPVSGAMWSSNKLTPQHVLESRAAAGDSEAQAILEAEQLRRLRLGAM